MSSEEQSLDRLRRFCLSLPETTEKDSWGHPSFRAGRRTFAAFEWIKGRPSIAIFLDSDEAGAFLLHNRNFFSTPYGKGKWISIWADADLDWTMIEEFIERAYRKVALKRMISSLDEERRLRGS